MSISSLSPSFSLPSSASRIAPEQGGGTGYEPGPRAEGDRKSPKGTAELSPDQWAEVQKLAATDAEVRAHEMAHLAAAGTYARSGPTFSYQTGPDGRRYAVGGEVQIDTSPDPKSPEATLMKARAIQAAASAPANPSSQDRAVAAAAAQMAMDAQREIAEKHKHPDASDSRAHAYQGDEKPKIGHMIDIRA